MIIIGAPIYKREWILPDWFAAIENQDYGLDRIGFAFEAAPDDDETTNFLFDWHANHPQVSTFSVSINSKDRHQSHPEGMRTWRPMRYHTMVNLRNNLLARVTCTEPDYYFSLDTDMILEDPQTITKLVELTSQYDVVSPLAYMSASSSLYPNYMSWHNVPGGRAIRKEYPIGTVFQSDVIMAAKLMTKRVYKEIRYKYHKQGEDLGWSANCAEAGFKLGAASNIYCPHIMHKSMLANYKESGDNRGKIVTNTNV